MIPTLAQLRFLRDEIRFMSGSRDLLLSSYARAWAARLDELIRELEALREPLP